ncbi:hypothetical protein ASPACDRAFT_112753 [Aspergillus aculeatus ATCC 16872]|uniref:6-methylsalicylate decarboxylase n=1 Tax=Aspergillus aculeatus (strain ATCC 16872 / CBS 172.66 / WB 5094) TaxID=690307 RepID=A0A1L9X289_ASPA1|nr:uncharacterized protein ASPACDRAFT_112753 [Aspergillus aculeatus ATCC 16872]OJK02607.1 hypothetical protein ASPACDRAFT_112753 [Aspergillus aculeatus ATCC 16872]
MTDRGMDWLQGKILAWTHPPPVSKIDTHHHFVPSFYREAVEAAGGDPSGWPTPSWSPLRSELLMKRLGIRTAILSTTAPGACILQGEASYKLARQLNEYAADLRDKHPDRYGFFANLPDILLHPDAALAELTYALDTLHADGVTLFTRYGTSAATQAYLGHPSLEPIWVELHRRKCVVFVHPTHPADTTPVNAHLPQPVIDYPHETTRTAMDMILKGTRRKYPDCRVILSHAGGTLPYLITRLATPLRKAPDLAAEYVIGTTYEQVMADFRSFHFDLALSATPQVVEVLRRMVPSDRILYGSDFPYAPLPAYPAFLEELEECEMSEELREGIYFGNARKLIPRLAGEAGREGKIRC